MAMTLRGETVPATDAILCTSCEGEDDGFNPSTEVTACVGYIDRCDNAECDNCSPANPTFDEAFCNDCYALAVADYAKRWTITDPDTICDTCTKPAQGGTVCDYCGDYLCTECVKTGTDKTDRCEACAKEVVGL